MALISVIIPVYNVKKYLRDCLNSVINQTLKDIEIICIDDGSTDGSAKILDTYRKKDDRIIIITKANNGQAIARNYGLKVASGKYILFVDSDDFLQSDFCEKMLLGVKDYNADYSMCGTNIIYKADRDLESMDKVHFAIKDEGFHKINSEFRASSFNHVLWNKLLKKSIIDEHLITFDFGFFEDTFFYKKYQFVSNTVFFIKDKLYNYYRMPSSYSTDIASKIRKNRHNILSKLDGFYEFVIKEDLYDKYCCEFWSFYIDIFKMFSFSISKESEREEIYIHMLKFLQNFNMNDLQKKLDNDIIKILKSIIDRSFFPNRVQSKRIKFLGRTVHKTIIKDGCERKYILKKCYSRKMI